jgi:hypothetical protein
MYVLVLVACDEDPTSTSGVDSDTTTPSGPTGVEPPGTTATFPDLTLTDLRATVSDKIASILVVSWNQDAPAETYLEFSFDKDEWHTSPPTDRKAGPQTELMLGAPFDSTVTWRLVATTGTGTYVSSDSATPNGPPPMGIPEAFVRVNDLERRDLEAGRYWFMGLAEVDWQIDPWWTIIIDDQARVVWAMRTPNNRGSMHAQLSRDGKTLLLDRNAFWPIFSEELSTIDQVTIDGTVVRTIPTPGMHHPFVELPDGTIAFAAWTSGAWSGDFIRLVYPDDTLEYWFDCEAWLNSTGSDYWCGSNTLTYDESTDTLLFSLYSVETIVAVEYSTGVATHWYGHAFGSYSFDPPGSAFWWQHGGHITAAGTLLTSSDVSTSGVEQVVREYEIDEANQTLREIWNFGIGEGLYGGVMGEATRLPNGNTVHNYGGLPRMREVTPDREVVLDIEWDGGGIGRTVPIADLYALAP